MKSQCLLPPQSFRRFQPRAFFLSKKLTVRVTTQHRASPKISRRFVEPEEFTEFAYAFICSLEAGWTWWAWFVWWPDEGKKKHIEMFRMFQKTNRNGNGIAIVTIVYDD
jgi:hypothetical protein